MSPLPRPALDREYRDAPSLKPLHDRLAASRSRTARETRILAEILQDCGNVDGRKKTALDIAQSRRQFVAALSVKDPDRDKRIAAFDALRTDRCAGLRDIQVSRAQVDALIDEAAAGGDAAARLRVVRRSIKDATMTEDQFNALKDIVATHDLDAAHEAFMLMALNASFSFRGGPRERDLDLGTLSNAWRLIDCELGAACGPDSPEVRKACQNEGLCDVRDVPDLVWNYHSSLAMREHIAEDYSGLSRILEQGDWSYFTIYRGPQPAQAIYMRPGP